MSGERRSGFGGSNLILAAFLLLFCGGIAVYGSMHRARVDAGVASSVQTDEAASGRR